MKKIIVILFSSLFINVILFSNLFINNTYAMSCSNPNFEDYIFNTHILKGKITNKTEVESGSMVNQYFLIEPIKFFTKETSEKLIVSNFISKSTITESKMSKQELSDLKMEMQGYDYNYDTLLDTSKEYYFFVDKNTNNVTVSPCSSRILDVNKLKKGYLAYKALYLFNTENIPLIK